MKKISLLILLAISSCKPHQKQTVESELSTVRHGNRLFNSCYSNSMYQMRLKEQLAYLGQEFLQSCFGKGRRARNRVLTRLDQNHQYDSIDSMWEGVNKLGQVDDANIFKLIEYDEKAFKRWEKFAKTENNSFRIGDPRYNQYLPDVFRPGGKLYELRIWESLRSHYGNNPELARDKADKFNDWRLVLGQIFTDSCKSQLITMHRRALELNRVVDDFLGLRTNLNPEPLKSRECCAGQGGIDYKNNNLTCKGSVQLKDKSYSKLPTNKTEPEVYFEWPTCGPQLGCLQRNTIQGSTYNAGGCARCELRVPHDPKLKSYYPWAVESKTGSYAYDAKIAEHTRVTCLTPAAARAASITFLSNHCKYKKGAPICDRVPVGESIGKNLKNLTPYVHCEKVKVDPPYFEPSRIAEGGEFGLNTSGSKTALTFVSSTSLAGWLGGSAKVRTPILEIFSLEAKKGASLVGSGESVYMVEQGTQSPLYVYRKGRVELGGDALGRCLGFYKNGFCSVKNEINGYAGGDSGVFGLKAEAKLNIDRCWSETAEYGTPFLNKVPIGGLSLSQVKEVCDQMRLADYDDFGGLFLEYIRKIDVGDVGTKLLGIELHKLDISEKNFYCVGDSPAAEKYSDEEFLDKGFRLDEVYLKYYSQEKMGLGVRSRKKNLKILPGFDGNVILPSPKDKIVEQLMEPFVSNQIIEDMINNELKSGSRGMGLMFHRCKRLKGAPVVYKFNPPIKCADNFKENNNGDKATPLIEASYETFEVNQISIQEKEDGLYLLSDAKALLKRAVLGKFSDLGEWGPQFRQGTLDKLDVIAMYQNLLKNNKSIDVGMCLQ